MKNGHKRLAFAVAAALNATAKRIQRAQQNRLERAFTIRKSEFMKRQAAIIKPFASANQGRPYVVISVGKKPRLLLSEFERGGTRKPIATGATRVAEPVIGGPARPHFKDPVTPELFVRKLKFKKTKTGKGPISARRTKTYLIPSTGIFQRVEGAASRLVYFFSSGKKIKPRLRWRKTADRVIQRWFKEEMERQVTKTVAHQKGRR